MRRAIVNEKLTGKETSTVHCFQVAGLGLAPFHFTGNMTESVHVVPGGDPKPGSSCDYCGTAIRYVFWVQSADNKQFKVGCDCIHKTGDRGLIQEISTAERKLRDMKNKAAQERKGARIRARIAAAKELLPSVCGRLADQPHPTKYFADQGNTLLDYVNWCFENHQGERAAMCIERESN